MWKLVCAKDSAENPLLSSLNDHVGRQTWKFDPTVTEEQKKQVEALREHYFVERHRQKHSADELLRLQSLEKSKSDLSSNKPLQISGDTKVTKDLVDETIKRGVSFYQLLQQDDGHWPGDYGGPMFLMPGLVITAYVTNTLNTIFSPEHKKEMIRYLINHQNEDGGYGVHIEGHSTMFGTVLSYVTLRILGLPAEDKHCVAARQWINERGGCTYVTSWGKFWLAVLGVYEWKGMNPLPPEMWLLPYSPWSLIGWAHPGRYWCHCRMVYLPMSYIYGKRFVGPQTDLTAALREELYNTPYHMTDWNAARSQCAKEDLYYPHPFIQDCIWWALYQVEPLLIGSKLRDNALSHVMQHIMYEDENTRYVDIGPVNKSINMLCRYVDDPEGEGFKRHLARVEDYLWVAEDGMKMQGYNGSQLWDTAFAVQAIHSTGMISQFSECLRNAHSYVERTQTQEDCPEPLSKWYRHISNGAWPFSTRDHGWPISDCSSEGLKAALRMMECDAELVGEPIAAHRLYDCVNVLLSFQNGTGGWATYENRRSFAALELLNPSEIFGDIMVDYDYVELTSACVTALADFRKTFPDHRANEISSAISRGIKWIKAAQKPDGSWYGSWGVCFTYGIWFGCAALAAVGENVHNSNAMKAAARFLITHQRADGGWGESYKSSQDCVYVQSKADESHVVNTAWAVLSLLLCEYHEVDPKPIRVGVRCLMKLQQPSGDWPQQSISGVFNKNCMITYANYRNIFPIWALGMYKSKVLGVQLNGRHAASGTS